MSQCETEPQIGIELQMDWGILLHFTAPDQNAISLHQVCQQTSTLPFLLSVQGAVFIPICMFLCPAFQMTSKVEALF